jgi:hypothetical protein
VFALEVEAHGGGVGVGVVGGGVEGFFGGVDWEGPFWRRDGGG